MQDITNTKPKRKELTDVQRGQIIGAYVVGASYDKISKFFKIAKSTVGKVCKLYKEKGITIPPTRPGRPQDFDHYAAFAMVRAFRAAPFLPVSVDWANFIKGGIEMSYTTFGRRMRDLGFSSYSPARKPALTDKHKQRRLKWCEKKVQWTMDQWKQVVWSDESRFVVVGNDGGTKVIRKKGERYLDEHILHTHKFGKGSIMVWGCFWFGGIGPLVTMTGTVNQEKYIDCLANHFLPWYEKLSQEQNKEYIFQEDGAPCHTGSYAKWYKEERCDVKKFNFWPAQSPDLNPIEHLWAYVSYKLRYKRGQFKNAAQLEAFVRKTWQEIPSIIFENLVSSMPARCQAVIDAKGGTTKY